MLPTLSVRIACPFAMKIFSKSSSQRSGQGTSGGEVTQRIRGRLPDACSERFSAFLPISIA
jgi:hypothetical protein